MLTAALVLAAFVAGVTGSWSPCGFSMITTLAPSGYGEGRRWVSVAGCLTFVPGALVGGVITFGSLSLVGTALGGGSVVVALAVAVALAAALGEARGWRIRPQVRRQVPEGWRRTLPLPVASSLYGVLLGLGFTTYVLTYAVWALAGICLALGSPALGLAVGLAFGVGRALPVVVIAPIHDRPLGARIADAMAERPLLLRGLRLADALALVGCALAIAPGTAAARAVGIAAPATDPTAAGADLAYQVPGGSGVLRRGGSAAPLAGSDPALGGPHLAFRTGGRIVVQKRATGTPVTELRRPRAGKLTVSTGWLAWREDGPRGDSIWAVPLRPGVPPREVASVRSPRQLSRPSLAGRQVAYGVAGPQASRIDVVDLVSSRRRVLARSTLEAQVSDPSLTGTELLYVRQSSCRQLLRLRALATGRERSLLVTGPVAVRDRGYQRGFQDGHLTGPEPTDCPNGALPSAPRMWTTALGRRFAYVTRLRPARDGTARAALLRVGR